MIFSLIKKILVEELFADMKEGYKINRVIKRDPHLQMVKISIIPLKTKKRICISRRFSYYLIFRELSDERAVRQIVK